MYHLRQGASNKAKDPSSERGLGKETEGRYRNQCEAN